MMYGGFAFHLYGFGLSNLVAVLIGGCSSAHRNELARQVLGDIDLTRPIFTDSKSIFRATLCPAHVDLHAYPRSYQVRTPQTILGRPTLYSFTEPLRAAWGQHSARRRTPRHSCQRCSARETPYRADSPHAAEHSPQR